MGIRTRHQRLGEGEGQHFLKFPKSINSVNCTIRDQAAIPILVQKLWYWISLIHPLFYLFLKVSSMWCSRRQKTVCSSVSLWRNLFPGNFYPDCKQWQTDANYQLLIFDIGIRCQKFLSRNIFCVGFLFLFHCCCFEMHNFKQSRNFFLFQGFFKKFFVFGFF